MSCSRHIRGQGAMMVCLPDLNRAALGGWDSRYCDGVCVDTQMGGLCGSNVDNEVVPIVKSQAEGYLVTNRWLCHTMIK